MMKGSVSVDDDYVSIGRRTDAGFITQVTNLVTGTTNWFLSTTLGKNINQAAIEDDDTHLIAERKIDSSYESGKFEEGKLVEGFAFDACENKLHCGKFDLNSRSSSGLDPQSSSGLDPQSSSGLDPQSSSGLDPQSSLGLNSDEDYRYVKHGMSILDVGPLQHYTIVSAPKAKNMPQTIISYDPNKDSLQFRVDQNRRATKKTGITNVSNNPMYFIGTSDDNHLAQGLTYDVESGVVTIGEYGKPYLRRGLKYSVKSGVINFGDYDKNHLNEGLIYNSKTNILQFGMFIENRLKKGFHINYGQQNPSYLIGEFQIVKDQQRRTGNLIKGLSYESDKWLKLGVYDGQSQFLNTGISISNIDQKPIYVIKNYERGPENELLTIKGLVYNTLCDSLQVGSYYTNCDVLEKGVKVKNINTDLVLYIGDHQLGRYGNQDINSVFNKGVIIRNTRFLNKRLPYTVLNGSFSMINDQELLQTDGVAIFATGDIVAEISNPINRRGFRLFNLNNPRVHHITDLRTKLHQILHNTATNPNTTSIITPVTTPNTTSIITPNTTPTSSCHSIPVTNPNITLITTPITNPNTSSHSMCPNNSHFVPISSSHVSSSPSQPNVTFSFPRTSSLFTLYNSPQPTQNLTPITTSEDIALFTTNSNVTQKRTIMNVKELATDSDTEDDPEHRSKVRS